MGFVIAKATASRRSVDEIPGPKCRMWVSVEAGIFQVCDRWPVQVQLHDRGRPDIPEQLTGCPVQYTKDRGKVANRVDVDI